MNLLALSGCDSVVQSAVVEEKDSTGQKKEENKKTVQKTVAEQVEAPETYRATIQADLRSADREDKENPMKFTLTADASIKVPDVDTICLKKVKRVAISKVVLPSVSSFEELSNISQSPETRLVTLSFASSSDILLFPAFI